MLRTFAKRGNIDRVSALAVALHQLRDAYGPALDDVEVPAVGGDVTPLAEDARAICKGSCTEGEGGGREGLRFYL